jgi:uncharacterized protein with PhoU and TrkA domain
MGWIWWGTSVIPAMWELVKRGLQFSASTGKKWDIISEIKLGVVVHAWIPDIQDMIRMIEVQDQSRLKAKTLSGKLAKEKCLGMWVKW